MSISEDWVREQFAQAKVKQATGTAVLRLLEVWNTMNHSETSAAETVEVFSKVALGHALAQQGSADEVWVQAQPGQITVGDEVRVKVDAYIGDAGQAHNGRRGRIVAIRYGDVIFKSDDGKEPVISGAHHSPYALEKRVR
jgi:hypothetical protein